MANWKKLSSGDSGTESYGIHMFGNLWYVIYKTGNIWIGHLFTRTGAKSFTPTDGAGDSSVFTNMEAAMAHVTEVIDRVKQNMDDMLEIKDLATNFEFEPLFPNNIKNKN